MVVLRIQSFVINGLTLSKKIETVVLLFIVFMVLAGRCLRLNDSISIFSSRSPVLVAMALREAGMSRQEAIDLVRTRRRGSFNIRQLEYLQNYHSAHRLLNKNAGCLIM